MSPTRALGRAGISVGGGRVHGQEEERLASRVLDVVPGVGRDRDERARSRTVLTASHPNQRLALDHVDDLVARVLLLGPAVGPGRDRHDGALASRRLLEYTKELTLVGRYRDDLHETSLRFLRVSRARPV